MKRYLVYKDFQKFKGKLYHSGDHFECKSGAFYDIDDNFMCLQGSQKGYDCLVGDDDDQGQIRGDLISQIDKMFDSSVDSDTRSKRLVTLWHDKIALLYNRGGDMKDTAWLWNNDFYEADIDDLKYILKLLEVDYEYISESNNANDN